jgi:outer membrane immunogenic protein
MRKVSAFTGAALLAAGPAFAADLAVKAPVYKVPPPTPVFNWTGFYVGGNAGYGWGAGTNPAISFSDPGNTFGIAQYFSEGGNFFPSLQPKGFIGGAQIGYDWQTFDWAPHLVLGVVADFQGADIAASGSPTVTIPGNVPTTETLSEKLETLGTVRARVGWAADNWLFYGSGGVAYGTVNSTLGWNYTSIAPAAFSGSQTDTRIGWTAGGGVNYAVTSHWIVGVDYLHYDLGHTSVTAPAVAPPGFASSLTADQTVAGDVVRGTISYKF